MFVINQQLGDSERVFDIALPDEVVGTDDRGPALPGVGGTRELV